VVWYFLAGDSWRHHCCLRWSLYELLDNLECVVFLIAVLVVYLRLLFVEMYSEHCDTLSISSSCM
jgi:hypothetical protein